MRSRIPWLSLVLLIFVLIAIFEPDIKAGNWQQIALKLALLMAACGAIWAYTHYQLRR